MGKHRFVTAVNCIDGRVQEPVSRWMTRWLAADYVDTVTEAGPDAVLAGGWGAEIESIKTRVLLSVNVHRSEAVAVVGHHDCTGDAVSDETHIEQIQRAAHRLCTWGLNARILGLWVNKRWTVELVCDTEANTERRFR